MLVRSLRVILADVSGLILDAWYVLRHAVVMVYCFACANCGETAEVIRPVSRYQDPMPCDKCGGPMGRDFRAEHNGPTTGQGGWPMKNWALGVQPEQRKEAMAHADSVGVPTHFDAEGAAVITDRSHYRRYCKALGVRNKDAGYGDA